MFTPREGIAADESDTCAGNTSATFITRTGLWVEEQSWYISDDCRWGQKYGDLVTNEYIYFTTCCFPQNITTAQLHCYDSWDDGWEGTTVTVESNGLEYCVKFYDGAELIETVNLVPAPPPPPSPPPLPNAPPLEVYESTVVITDSLHSTQLLSGAIKNDAVDTIMLHVDVYVGENVLPNVNTSLSIVGACNSSEGTRCVLDGEERHRIFVVDAGVVFVLKDLILRNGKPTNMHTTGGLYEEADGGALIVYGDVRLEGCLLQNNMASDGGGLFCYKGSITLNHTQVLGNMALTGGGLSGTECDIKLLESEISQNYVASTGGGLHLELGSAFTSTNSSVCHNYAGDVGAGLYLSESTALVHGSIICNNTSEEDGGGASLDDSSVLQCIDSDIRYNTAFHSCGGIYLDEENQLLVLRSNVHHNNAYDGSGGGVGTANGNLVNVSNSVVTNNVAANGGGGLHILGSSSLVLGDSSLIGNNKAEEGGGIYGGAEAKVVANSIVLSGNTAERGGGVYLYNSDFANIQVSFNRASNGGGCYFGVGGNSSILNSHLTLNNALKGSALNLGDEAVLEVEGCSLSGNTAVEVGGGVAISHNSQLRMQTTSLSNNSAEFGAAVFCVRGFLQSAQSAITENVANEAGGAIYSNACNVTFGDDTMFSTNEAVNGNGGAICLRHSSVGRFTGNFFAGNSAASFGGVFQIQRESTVYLQDSVAASNTCKYEGGDISAQDSYLIISGSHLRLAHTMYSGGSIQLFNSWATLLHSNISQASSRQGGAIACLGSTGREGELSLDNVVLFGNIADTGGAFALKFCVANVTSSRLVANNASMLGAGIYMGLASSCTVQYCAFLKNQVMENEDGRGGGIMVDSNTGVLEVEDTLFEAGNAAQGSGIFSQAPQNRSVVRLQSLVFRSNQAHVGPNIFWIYASEEADERRSYITCANCTYPAETTLFSTTAVAYKVLLQETFEPIQTLQLTSGGQLPAVVYVANDFYENRTRLPSEYLSVVASSSAQLGGKTLINMNMTERTATFSDIVMTGEPGRAYNLTFTPSAEQWHSVNLNIELLPCNVGEVYSLDSNLCTACEEGFIKFDNLSTACESCEGIDGLRCLGGSQFILEDGYWMSSEYIEAYCDISEAECAISKVHECALTEACSTPNMPNRTNVQGEPYIRTDILCNTENGYRSNSVICAGCEAGYHYHTTSGCLVCPSQRHLVWIHLLGLLLSIVVIFLVCTKILTYVQGVSPFSAKSARAQIRSKTLVGILVGHVQVMSQTLLVFSSTTVPPLYKDFLVDTVMYVNLSLTDWIPLSCLAYSLGAEVSQTSFYWEFSAYCILLLLGLTVLAVRVGYAYSVTGFTGVRARTRLQKTGHKVKKGDMNVELGRTGGGASAETRDSKLRGAQGSDAMADDLRLNHGSVSSIVNPIANMDDLEKEPDGQHGNEEPVWQIYFGVGGHIDGQEGGEQLKRQATGQEGGEQLERQATGQEGGEQLERQATGREGGLLEKAAPSSRCGDGEEISSEASEWRRMRKLSSQKPKIKSGINTGKRKSRMSFEKKSQRIMGNLINRFSLIGYVLVFLHPTVATNVFQLFNCTLIYQDSEDQYWLKLDRQVECYTPEWYLFAGLASCVMVIYIFGLPFCLAAVPYYLTQFKLVCRVHNNTTRFVHRSKLFFNDPDPSQARTFSSSSQDLTPGTFYVIEEGKQVLVEPQFVADDSPLYDKEGMSTALHHEHALAFLAAYMHPFKDQYYYWLPFEMIRKLAQTSFVIIWQYIDEESDMLYQVMVTCSAVAIHAYCRPYESNVVNRCQTVLLVDQVFVSLLMLAYKSQEGGSKSQGLMIVVSQITLMVVLAGFVLYDLYVAYKVPALEMLCWALSIGIERAKLQRVGRASVVQHLQAWHDKCEASLEASRAKRQ
ncbi:hypothetical protein CYMTET_6530 [Cymbomonas tetramitiformis]|uniref:Right handed beta helix domain-containing protein n=1 Tax=Cymbomonas tetramitiformis TaxID=36881 RepID=A0AAE0GWX5_9CHLO|nr:hypothetical protein CYMTET_6530 [Cymbomonas tetramitiformis]